MDKSTSDKAKQAFKKIVNKENYQKIVKQTVDASKFSFIQIKPGNGIAIIFIDGFLTAENENTDDWEAQLQQLYPDNPWYYVSWESENLKALGTQVGFYVAGRVALTRVITSATPIGWPLTAYALLNNPWSRAYQKAKLTGELLAQQIIEKDRRFIMFGHSLGARVAYYALRHLVDNNLKVIHDVHLLGGAVGNDQENWLAAQKGVRGSINNYQSVNDKILSHMYQVGTAFMSKPIGIHDIDVEGINNIDVSDHVEGHTKYKENISKFLLREGNLIKYLKSPL